MRTKNYVWLFMLTMVSLCIGDSASASLEAETHSLSAANDLLQFKAGSHVMGFKPDRVYLANTAGFLSVEFLNGHPVSPKSVIGDAGQSNSGNAIANLQRVEYPCLWNGITLRYDAVAEGVAESTYFIQPGADVADIRLHYNSDIELQQDGSLKIQLPTRQGYITESSPVAWQMVNGKKKPVDVAFEIKDGTVGFKAGEYDRAQELIIDPTYQWHSFYGSASLHDRGMSIAVDDSGNVYVTGQSEVSWDSTVANGVPPKHAHSGGYDIVVLKLNSSGQYQWHTFYGSSALDQGYSIAIDSSGNVYVTGSSGASWIYGAPLGVAPKHAHSGGDDIVVLKLNSSGQYQWHTFYGSADTDIGNSIAVDGSGNAYVAGASNATWNRAGIVGLPLHAYSAGYDMVILKLNSSGMAQWHTFYGSTGSDKGFGIAVDGSEKVYISGNSDNGNWNGPPPVNAYQGGMDIVVLNLNSSGTLDGHTFLGSAGNDYAGKIAVDGSGNIYVTGDSAASWGAPVHAHSGLNDIVICKLFSSGNLAWNTFLGSSDYDYGIGIAVDGSGNVYVAGESDNTWGKPLHPFSGSLGSSDIVVAKLISDSGGLAWNTFYGSSDWDYSNAITVDKSGNIYVTGASFATWGNPLNSLNNMDDITVIKLSEFPWPMFLPAIIKGGQQ